jgi:hypothetical protein
MRRRRSPPNTLRTDDQIVTYYRQAAEAIGPDVPFVLQDYPLRLCHGNRAGAKTPRLRPTSRGGAAAAHHRAVASARKARSVRREIRWRWTLNVL